MPTTAPWVTYRPEIKVLDCTIRDGGLINDHHFDDGFVRAVFETCVAAGINYMEVGYKNSKRLFTKDQFGAWKHCDEDDIRRIVGDNNSDLKLSAMADAEKSDYKQDIVPKEESPLDLIRIATYVHQIPTAVDMINDAHQKGYETSCNIMAISTASEAEIDQALEVLLDTPADVIVVVDSFGALYHEQIRSLVRKYVRAVKGSNKQIGIHAHNNQQLAFANTIEGIIQGANRIDATMAGMGRGAGNCPMELLLGFLRNPRFHLRPVLDLLEKHFVPLQEKLEWGALVPYMVTGQLNQHPRAAIKIRSTREKNKYVKFYDSVVADL